MKSFLLFTLTLFVCTISIAQTGINYKALIRDTIGIIINNREIDMVFTIEVDNVSVYSESQQIITDSNGIAIAVIGTGTVISGDFNAIDWKFRDAELNVQIDVGNGIVNLGNSPFNAVPYAIQTLNTEGLETINEGNGEGLRLAVRSPSNVGDIGIYALDLSYSTSESTTRGATGSASLAMGVNTTASNQGATAMGVGSVASGFNATAMGSSTSASALNATAMGNVTNADGINSTAMGERTTAGASYSTAIGRYNIGGGNAQAWIETDPLFEIGIGSGTTRANALTVYKNGRMRLNSSTVGFQIFSEGLSGIDISSGNEYGIRVTGANRYGGVFIGDDSGVYADAAINANPDIILAGDSGNANDNGIIASDPSHAGSDIYLRSNDAVVIELDSNNDETGEFQIINGAGTEIFEVRESGNATLAGSLSQNSDRRLKKDIEALPYGLKEILQLEPKQYFWKNQEQNKKSLGLIAQDLQPIINEIVNTQDDEAKTLGISYIELIPVLIKAIQEQQIIIQGQDQKINNLTAEIVKKYDTQKLFNGRLEKMEAIIELYNQ